VERGQIVDGLGGSSGPIGVRSPGALDGEVAYLLGTITKRALFDGGAATVAGEDPSEVDWLATPTTPSAKIAWFAFMESAVKAVVTLSVAAPSAREVVISGRMAEFDRVRDDLARRLSALTPKLDVQRLHGFATAAKQGAQGAALIADGLAGGREAELVHALGLQHATGTVLDHLALIQPTLARARLGLLDA
jgi:predicted butyrate kinase (DUF1464 family)